MNSFSSVDNFSTGGDIEGKAYITRISILAWYL